MTGAFTLFNRPYAQVKYTILYGIYYQPDMTIPNSTEDFTDAVNYLPYMIYPYEVVRSCQK